MQKPYFSSSFHVPIRIASLIADSKRLHEMRINPVAQFRRENKNEKLPKLSLKNNLKVPNVKQYHQETSYYADHLGDGMPDTAMAMSNLFGLHPLPKRKRVINQKSDISALSSSEEAGDVKIVNDYPDSVPFDPNPPNENLMAYVRHMAIRLGILTASSAVSISLRCSFWKASRV